MRLQKRRYSSLFVSLMLFSVLAGTAGAQGQAAPRAAEPAPNAAGQSGAAPSAAGQAARLPVRRVVLYKNGVGYFEHLGRVRGSQDVSIDFTSAQLNDVLKSLTTLDLGQGRITGVSYNSDAPLVRRLGALRLPLGENATPAQFLAALRGARLEVRAGATVFTGRLLGVETRTRTKDGVEIPTDEATLITDAGEMRVVELGPGVNLRLAERDLAGEVGRYLDLLSSSREKDLRRMVISTAGAGERPLFVSYISEVPVWKTTYRLVLPSKPGAKPLLQGWAIVDNTVGEDWTGVELSLVAGAPQSFIQQLSQPYYSRRPVVPLPESAMLKPQTHTATLTSNEGQLTGMVTDPSGAVVPGAQVRLYNQATNQLVAQQEADAGGNYSFNVPAGRYWMAIELTGFRKTVLNNLSVDGGDISTYNAGLQLGDVASTVTVDAVEEFAMKNAPARSLSLSTGVAGGVGRGSGVGYGRAAAAPPPMASPTEAIAAMTASAQARELGDLFEYKLKEPVTIRKNQSAMAPIIHTEIAAEKVSLWSEASGTARPRRALWLTNSSALTLDGGSFSMLEDETFAGEGLTETIKPGEKRLLSYAVDLGVLVDTKRESERQAVTRVRLQRGVMTLISEEREQKTYTIRNEDTTPRALILEHPVRPEWKFTKDTAAPAESSADAHRFRVPVEPKKTATLAVKETRPIQAQTQLINVTDEQIGFWIRAKSINSQVEEALRGILLKKMVVGDFLAQINSRNEQVRRIFEDQSRVRENMKALKGSSEEKELLQRYTRQLNEQENRLETLRGEIAQLEEKRRAAQADLDKLIQELSLDVAL